MRPALLVIAALVSVTIAAGPPVSGPACSAAAYRQFDFFLGDWDTYDIAAGGGSPDTLVARNHVTSMLAGCAVREVYEQRDGLRGESFSAWDAASGRWHQSWVTNRGQLLLLDGELAGGRMVLTARERQPDGTSTLLRGTWWREGRTVRELAERSRDSGHSWEPVFDIVFRPHRTH